VPCVVVVGLSAFLVFRFIGLCVLTKRVVGFVQRNVVEVMNGCGGPCVVLDDLLPL
jgi:hypothetical protein